MTGPYADAAWLYRKAGWQGVIPIGRRPAEKSPPPTGFTGYAGVDPSGPDVQTWIDGPEGAYNIGLHLPDDIYVLDVDERNGGVAALAELAARIGRPLPKTVTSTAHGPASGNRHYFFRATLPAGRVWRDHPGSGLDSLHVGHRYAVVWPSAHPKGGTYAWYVGTEPWEIPAPGDLAELDAEWVEACSQPGEPLEGVAASDSETLDVIRHFRVAEDGHACLRVRRLLAEELFRMAGAEQKALHAPGPLYALTSYGIEGHAGVAAALSQHQAAHVDARVRLRGEGQSGASAEWWRMVRGAVGKRLVVSEGAITGMCGCDRGPRDRGGQGLPIPGIAPDDMEILRAELLLIDDPAERLAHARRAAGVLASLDDAELLPWRDMLKEIAGLNFGDFKTIIGVERAAAGEAAKAERAEVRTRKGPELPHRAAPMPVARALDEQFKVAGRHLRFWRGDWYVWQGPHYRAVSLAAVRAMIYESTEPCWFDDPEDGPKPWNPDTAAVNKVLDAFAHGPAYRTDEADEDRGIATANGVLDLVTGHLLPHTPDRFNLWSLPYPYVPQAGCPQWLAFLEQVMPDPENRQLLQEWFGYMVSGRTDLQKILSLFGAPRSGKGTVLRVLVALVGAENRATVTLSQLASTFGRESLVARTMAQITDANWNIRDIDVAVEALKSISGEDDQGIDRKNRVTWEGRLGVRFVLVANPMPKFNDPSGALLSRMLHIEFSRSFLGREDEGLTPRLLTELPGILNWALAGLAQLSARGRLYVPAASREAAEDIERTTSPVAGFLRDRTVSVDPAMCVGIYLDELHHAYTAYRSAAEVQRPTSRDVFARDLRAAGVGGIVIKRVWLDRDTPHRRQVSMVFGLVLLDGVTVGAAPLLGQPSR